MVQERVQGLHLVWSKTNNGSMVYSEQIVYSTVLRPRARNFDRATAMGKTDPGPAPSVGRGIKIASDDGLCGVKAVPGQILVAAAAGYDVRPAFGSNDATIPREFTQARLATSFQPGPGGQNRSTYGLTPETLLEVKYPERARKIKRIHRLTHTDQYMLGGRGRVGTSTVTLNNIPPLPRPAYNFKPNYADGASLASNNIEPGMQKGLDLMMQTERVFAGRIPRAQGGAYEAARTERVISSVTNFQEAATGQRYLRACYVLASRLLQALYLREQGNGAFGALAQANVPPEVPLAQITYLHTSTLPAATHGANNGNAVAFPDPLNPESYLDLPGVRDNLRSGHSVILDVAGMSTAQVREYVNAFFLQDERHRWEVAYNAGNAQNPNIQQLMSPLGRETIRGAQHLYLHWGSTPSNRVIPLAQLRGAPAAGQVDFNFRHSPLNVSVIINVFRSLIARHHCGADAAVALETAMYRSQFYHTADFPQGLRRGAQQHVLANGARNLQLPRDYTYMQYYDFMFLESEVPKYVSDIFTMCLQQPNVAKWTMYYLNLHMAQSLNWPSTTLSFKGEVLHALHQRIGNAPNINISGELDEHLTRMHANFYMRRDDVISMWQVAHKNAMAHRFGYSPSTAFFELSAPIPVDVWADNRPIYLAHAYHSLWMAQCIPYHAVLPTHKSVPLWNDEEYTPDQGLYHSMTNARFGGFIETHESVKYLSDDGSDFCFQHFLGIPDLTAPAGHQDRWDDALAPRLMQPVVWNVPRDYETPSTAIPSASNVTFSYNYNGGQNPLSLFALPGSFTNVDWANWRTRAGGVWMTPHCRADPRREREVSEAMRSFFPPQNVPRQSVTIAVLPPVWTNSFAQEASEYVMYPLFSKTSEDFGGFALFSPGDGHDITSIRTSSLHSLSPGPMANVLPAVLQNHNPRVSRRPHQIQGPALFDRITPYATNMQGKSVHATRVPAFDQLVSDVAAQRALAAETAASTLAQFVPEMPRVNLPSPQRPSPPVPAPTDPKVPIPAFDGESRNPYDAANLQAKFTERATKSSGDAKHPKVEVQSKGPDKGKEFSWNQPPPVALPSQGSETDTKPDVPSKVDGLVVTGVPPYAWTSARGILDDAGRLTTTLEILDPSTRETIGFYNPGDLPPRAPKFEQAPMPRSQIPRPRKTMPVKTGAPFSNKAKVVAEVPPVPQPERAPVPSQLPQHLSVPFAETPTIVEEPVETVQVSTSSSLDPTNNVSPPVNDEAAILAQRGWQKCTYTLAEQPNPQYVHPLRGPVLGSLDVTLN